MCLISLRYSSAFAPKVLARCTRYSSQASPMPSMPTVIVSAKLLPAPSSLSRAPRTMSEEFHQSLMASADCVNGSESFSPSRSKASPISLALLWALTPSSSAVLPVASRTFCRRFCPSSHFAIMLTCWTSSSLLRATIPACSKMALEVFSVYSIVRPCLPFSFSSRWSVFSST